MNEVNDMKQYVQMLVTGSPMGGKTADSTSTGYQLPYILGPQIFEPHILESCLTSIINFYFLKKATKLKCYNS